MAGREPYVGKGDFYGSTEIYSWPCPLLAGYCRQALSPKLLDEPVCHLGAYLETLRADVRAEGGVDIGGSGAEADHLLYGFGCDTCHCPSPAGVDRCHYPSAGVGEKDWDAVGGVYAEGYARVGGDEGINILEDMAGRGEVDCGYVGAVGLTREDEPRWVIEAKGPGGESVGRCHILRISAGVEAGVKPRVRVGGVGGVALGCEG